MTSTSPSNGSPPDGIVLGTIRAQRASHTSPRSTQSPSKPPPSPSAVNGFDDDCWNDVDDMDSFDIERNIGDSQHVHPKLDELHPSLGFENILTA